VWRGSWGQTVRPRSRRELLQHQPAARPRRPAPVHGTPAVDCVQRRVNNTTSYGPRVRQCSHSGPPARAGTARRCAQPGPVSRRGNLVPATTSDAASAPRPEPTSHTWPAPAEESPPACSACRPPRTHLIRMNAHGTAGPSQPIGAPTRATRSATAAAVRSGTAADPRYATRPWGHVSGEPAPRRRPSGAVGSGGVVTRGPAPRKARRSGGGRSRGPRD